MNRRQFLKTSSAIASLGVLSLGSYANGAVSCGPYNYQGIQACQAGIKSNLVYAVGQQKTQWCWAACIEMVFGYYGLRLSQSTIVKQTWGKIVNLPAQPNTILANLNRTWKDSNNRRYLVSGNSYSANHVTAAQDLASNMPLIIGTQNHAMVLTAVHYNRDQFGNGQIVKAIVRDPWPNYMYPNGLRVLTPKEWYSATFLARIRVQRIYG